ncbi:sulfite reductase subunit alpha [Chitinimonas koreensis]|uniref:sulfite reductase subunit alpha n=1 Tax=Chitinimonas koreensis TaxID=356302 RepID=UPI001654375E|nr:sulfite reductase subunit alpha [Chitinimonas koreensis]QNM97735.1 flavodoxin domain-containing protein [Chitinimonas koreensis]
MAAAPSALRLGQPVLQRLLDPAATTVAVREDAPLAVAELSARAAAAFPGRPLRAVAAPDRPGLAARVELATAGGGVDTRYLDPYDGKPLARPAGRRFFAALAQRHARLGGHPASLLLGAAALAALWRLRRTAPAAGARRAALLVAHASQTGHAEALAGQTAAALAAAGLEVELRPLGELRPADLARHARALLLVSTFGDGESPDSAHAFARQLRGGAALAGLEYGLLALGDRSYPAFCGFGRQLDGWLREHGARPWFDRIEVDRSDPAAIAAWRRAIEAHCALPGGAALPAWQEAAFEPWPLTGRALLNPGSLGGATVQVTLQPPSGAAGWDSGDVVEILPRQAPARVAGWLAERGLDGAAPVRFGGRDATLAQALAASEAPPAGPAASAQALADALQPLRPREYSIASLASEGRLELMVRQIALADGLGIGSGWLTEYAEPGGPVLARLRANPSFHLPAEPRPLVLVGNGTGLASLRAHLKACAAAGHGGHWLIFGERSAAHDFYHRGELEAWLADGTLARLDTAFSRDQAERIYVQDLLRAAADELQAWLARGAAIYVCGSAAGMAPAVHAVLLERLGEAGLDALIAAGRYRRDVY